MMIAYNLSSVNREWCTFKNRLCDSTARFAPRIVWSTADGWWNLATLDCKHSSEVSKMYRTFRRWRPSAKVFIISIHIAEYIGNLLPSFHIELLYRAPELLRSGPSNVVPGSQKADIYSFGIVLYEIHTRHGPFGDIGLTPMECLKKVLQPNDFSYPFR